MSDFPLIKDLQSKSDKTPIPKGMHYIEHEIVVEGSKTTVHIPAKESETFLAETEGKASLDKYEFNKIMRKVRGIRG